MQEQFADENSHTVKTVPCLPCAGISAFDREFDATSTTCSPSSASMNIDGFRSPETRGAREILRIGGKLAHQRFPERMEFEHFIEKNHAKNQNKWGLDQESG